MNEQEQEGPVEQPVERPAPPPDGAPVPAPAGADAAGELPVLDFDEVVEALRERHPGFAPEAYHFVREALDLRVSTLEERRHISGPELLEGVRRLALDRFGPMARTVLNHWGVTAGEDVGRIVFQLVEAGILSKTEEDSPDDFAGVIRFDESFEAEYRWPGSSEDKGRS